VLIVDDEAPIRELVARAIRAAGAEVRQAADAAQAETIAASTPLDLLITDIAMPGASGWDLALRLRATWPNLPVLFITGYVADAATRRALAHADDEVLSKPFTLDAIVEAARRAIARRDRAR
jgi:DNA-binding response OmpR family regulator